MVKLFTRDESLKRIPPFLTQRSGELLPSLGVRRPSSVVNIFKNLLLCNY